jgi:hypothetical protein
MESHGWCASMDIFKKASAHDNFLKVYSFGHVVVGSLNFSTVKCQQPA